MTSRRSPRNIVASIHQRLLNLSRQSGRPFNDLAIHFAVERFLYRLSLSPYADRMILKGGLLLHVWRTPVTRMTRDIDLLGRLSHEPAVIAEAVRRICEVRVEDDGLVFERDSVVIRPITKDADYEGARASFRGRFGKIPLAMQIDLGFGDSMTPGPIDVTYPSLLGHPQAALLAYNRETMVAEKFQTMVKLGELNSRMRDFFDVWALAQAFAFDERPLADAIRSTFSRRGTPLAVAPACFDRRFSDAPAKAAQWKGFLQTARVSTAPGELAEAIDRVRDFLDPVVNGLVGEVPGDRLWAPGGPWSSRPGAPR